MERFCTILLFNIPVIWIDIQYWILNINNIQYSSNIDELVALARGGAVLQSELETQSELFANHNPLGELIKPASNRVVCVRLGREYCNNVNYVKNYAIFEPPSMRSCSRTSPKQNQDFVKEHNRTPLKILDYCRSQCMCAFWTFCGLHDSILPSREK